MAWNNLSDDKKKIMSSRMDEKFHLPPYSSFEFLSGWLGSKDFDKEKLWEELKKINIDELKKVVAANEALKDEVHRINEEIIQLSRRMTNVEQAQEELKEDVIELKENQLELKQSFDKITIQLETAGVQQSIQQNVIHNHDELVSFLEMSWVKERPPVTSCSMDDKIDNIVQCIKSGQKVVITGEAEIGKTTLLYLVCVKLLELRIVLYTSLGQFDQPNAVLIVTHLARKPRLSEVCTKNAIATSTSEEWENRSQGAQGWVEFELSGKEYETVTLTNILISSLKQKNIQATKEGITIAVEKSEGSPGYLIILTEYLEQIKCILTEETALRVPKRIYQIEAQQLKYIKEDSLSIAILYALAKTKRLRLHARQIKILLNLFENSKELSLKSQGNAWAFFTYTDVDIYGLSHESMKDVLLKDWKTLGLGLEPHSLIDVRNMLIHNKLGIDLC